MTDKQSVIKLSADATGVREGVAEAKTALKEVETAAVQAGTKGGAGIEKIGAGFKKTGDEAANGAKKVERASKSIELSLQREIALVQAGSRGTREYYEVLANQRGLDTKRFEPLLAQLDAVNLKMKAGGISAGQYQNAMRMVPMQLTDIVTQLAGGQNPFLIAIQQSGQLRDSFGGFGEMFKSLATVITPARIAMTGAASAVLGIGYAMHEGAAESRAYQNAITLAGDSIDVTAGRLQYLGTTVGETTKFYGTAREAVMALASTGKVAAADYEQVAKSLVYQSEATGKSVQDLVGEYSKIADDPLKAVIDLSAKYQIMTQDVYEQVQALQEQGKEQEAVRLVQQKYAQEVESNSKQVVDNIGLIEQAWRGVKNATGEVWDLMKSIGRDTTLEDQIARIGGQIEYWERFATIGNQGLRNNLKAEQSALKLGTMQMDISAKIRAEETRQNHETLEVQERLNKQAADAASNQVKKANEIKKIQQDIAIASRGASAEKLKELKAQEKLLLASVEEKYKEKSPRGGNSREKYASPYSGSYRISSEMSGARKNPVDGQIKAHTGVDVAMPIGTQLKAMASGQVVFAGVKGGYGNAIIIAHDDGTKSLYGHLSKSLAKSGQRVNAGEAVALSGNTGRSSGPHAHIETWNKKGQRTDFRDMVGKSVGSRSAAYNQELKDLEQQARAKEQLEYKFADKYKKAEIDFNKDIAALRESFSGKELATYEAAAKAEYDKKVSDLKNQEAAEKLSLDKRMFQYQQFALSREEIIKRNRDFEIEQVKTDGNISSADKETLITLIAQKAETDIAAPYRDFVDTIKQTYAVKAFKQELDWLNQAAQGGEISIDQFNQRLKELNANKPDALKTDFERNWAGTIEWVNSAQEIQTGLDQGMANWLQGSSDALADFVTTGKADFRDFTVSILKDLARIAMQKAIAGVVGNLFGGAGGGGTNAYDALFADGGYTGDGGKFEPAGIVHKGEGVLNQSEIRALGGEVGFNLLRGQIASLPRHSDGGMAGRPMLPKSVRQGGGDMYVTNSISISTNSDKPEEIGLAAQEGIEKAMVSISNRQYRINRDNDLRVGGTLNNAIRGK